VNKESVDMLGRSHARVAPFRMPLFHDVLDLDNDIIGINNSYRCISTPFLYILALFPCKILHMYVHACITSLASPYASTRGTGISSTAPHGQYHVCRSSLGKRSITPRILKEQEICLNLQIYGLCAFWPVQAPERADTLLVEWNT
jgi:hypothetical protein